ncbi:unnamed protein product [Caenorhabditis auriculariae]|uniref:Fibrinogen C-terminal domain-containing protein n=1 Tax=Caenorhabditis auriculariae TaxID=2777116 RepID=A0A8S1H3Y4_9PELO|nr:unnamed protein product [Caenorhabditis auriculariae]
MNAFGKPCSEYDFIGVGCNLFLSGTIIANNNKKDFDLGQVTFGSNFGDIRFDEKNNQRVTWLNLPYNGFLIHVKLSSDNNTLVDSFNVSLDASSSTKGYQVFTSDVGTVLSFAWTSNATPTTPTAGTTTVSGSTGVSGQTVPTTTAGPILPTSCDKIENLTTSGVQTIYIGGQSVDVFCEVVQPSGEVFTVIQSRGNEDTTDFDVSFDTYKSPLGNAGKATNFWLGLDNMNQLTGSDTFGLEIDLCCNGAIKKSSSTTISSATADFGNTGLNYPTTFKPAGTNRDIGVAFSTNATYVGNRAVCEELEYEDDAGNEIVPSGGWCISASIATNKALGINMRTTDGPFGSEGDDVDFVSYDRVRMAIFTFDSAKINQNSDDAQFCT